MKTLRKPVVSIVETGDLDKYFLWILDLVDLKTPSPELLNLLSLLKNTDCYVTNKMDHNRILDGIDVRRQYDRNTENKEACSILELLVGIALRINNITYEPGFDKTGYWFSVLLRNLNLKTFGLLDSEIEQKNMKKLKNFMDRKITSDGKGGIFPLKYPKRDQRKLEIWYQMMDYLSE